MKFRKTQFSLSVALFGFVLLLASARAAYALAPCCNITSINSKTGVVTAKVDATGEVFQFKLNNAAELKTLRVGQGIYANMSAKQVSLDGKNVVGTIVSTSQRSAGGAVLTSSASQACNVVLVNADRDVGVAEDQNSRIFEFTAGSGVLQDLRPHQRIYASFAKKQVSLDGQTAAGSITRIIDPAAPAGNVHLMRENYTCYPGYCWCSGGADSADCRNMAGDPHACKGYFECDSKGRCFCSRPPE